MRRCRWGLGYSSPPLGGIRSSKDKGRRCRGVSEVADEACSGSSSSSSSFCGLGASQLPRREGRSAGVLRLLTKGSNVLTLQPWLTGGPPPLNTTTTTTAVERVDDERRSSKTFGAADEPKRPTSHHKTTPPFWEQNRTHTHTHAHTNTHTHTHKHTQTQTHTHTNTHTQRHTHKYTLAGKSHLLFQPPPTRRTWR